MDDLIHYKKRTYYAQNREDLILRAFFPDVDDGFYVDIGAYDPEFESVTKYFYLHGWMGINVEPQPENAKKFIKKRPKDINLNLGISNEKSTLTLRSYQNGGLSTFSKDMKDSYKKQSHQTTDSYVDIEVEVITLKEMFEKANVGKRTIYYMKVDVEGLEYEVLEGNDWQKYRPEVLCIEANHIAKDWRGLLEKNDYERVFFDGLNDYFVDAKTDRKQKFDYVQSVVLEKGGGINIADYEVLLRIKKERDELGIYAKHLVNEVAARDKIISNQKTSILSYESTLSSIKKTNRHLASLVSSRLRRRV